MNDPKQYLIKFDPRRWREYVDLCFRQYGQTLDPTEKNLLQDAGLPEDVRQMFVLIHGPDSPKIFNEYIEGLEAVPRLVAQLPRGGDILRGWLMTIPID